MEDIRNKNSIRLYEVLIAVLSLLACFVSGILYKADVYIIVKNLIVIGIMVIALLFVIELDHIKGKFSFDNDLCFWRFFIVYCIFLAISCVFPNFPSAGWAFLCIFISLSLFSNGRIGFLAGLVLLTNTVLISNQASEAYYLVYAIPGVVGVVLFESVDEEFKVIKPIIISILLQFLSLCVSEVLLANKVFSINLFMFPAVNVLICLAVLLFVLKLFSFSQIYKTHDRYMDVNDPEFHLLVSLKEKSKSDYDHTIYTAVLCSKLAKALKLDENLCKACGYYHRIGILTEDNSPEGAVTLMEENDIPSQVIELLKEYVFPNRKVKSKETVVLLFADTVVSSIKYLFEKDKDVKIDYARLVDAVIEKKMPLVSDSRISYEDMNIIRKVLVNENLFYDFLR